MARSSFASALVLDPEGRIVAGMGDHPEEGPLEGPGVERVQLPDGGFLITRRAAPDAAWSRFSRAFIHEARSPLNALTIYLELLNTRLVKGASTAVQRPEAAPDRVLSKANDQVRRIEELLRAFGELWGARGDNSDFAEILRSACRFAEHEALRHSVQLTHAICPMAVVACSPMLLADATVTLLGAALLAPADTKLEVALTIEGREVLLSVHFAGTAPDLLELLRPGADALSATGGTVELHSHGLIARYPLVEPAPGSTARVQHGHRGTS
jgi:hypothetical protein